MDRRELYAMGKVGALRAWGPLTDSWLVEDLDLSLDPYCGEQRWTAE